MLSALNKKLKASISLRIAFLFSLTFSVGLVFAFLISYLQISYSFEQSSRDILSAKFRETTAIVQNEGLPGLRKYEAEEKNRILNAGFLIRVLTTTGETLYIKPSVQQENFDFDKAFRRVAPESIAEWQSLAAVDDEDHFELLTQKSGNNYYLQVGKSSEDREEILSRILTVFALTGGLLTLLSGGLGGWYARKSLAPIRTLLATVKKIENGDLSKRVVVTGAEDELRDLGETFNRMVSRIEKLIQVMKESLDNVAHDIRTPLTRIRAVAEDALISENTSSLKEALGECAESATNISDLVEQLMSISEAEAGTLRLRFEDCHINTLVCEVVEIYEFVAQEKHISIEVKPISEDLNWVLDRKRIKQALANLIDNAVKFSPPEKSVWISATLEQNNLILKVEDQGQGVPSHELPRIWERLFRGDKSRTTQGAGLGLAIVRSIAVAHGGWATATPAVESGMVFSITIPLVNGNPTVTSM
jgi:signal transduction histidine kinase